MQVVGFRHLQYAFPVVIGYIGRSHERRSVIPIDVINGDLRYGVFELLDYVTNLFEAMWILDEFGALMADDEKGITFKENGFVCVTEAAELLEFGL